MASPIEPMPICSVPQDFRADVGVMEAAISPLRRPDIQPPAGPKIKLGHLDVSRQTTLTERCRVGEVRIVAKQTLYDRVEQPAFELRPAARLFQCQRCQYLELDARIAGCAIEQRISDMVRLPEAERQREQDAPTDALDDRIRASARLGKPHRPPSIDRLSIVHLFTACERLSRSACEKSRRRRSPDAARIRPAQTSRQAVTSPAGPRRPHTRRGRDSGTPRAPAARPTPRTWQASACPT